MVSKIISNKNKFTKRYPMLLIDENEECVVLMTDDNIGTVVYSNSDEWKLGDCQQWDIDEFSIFNGTIELSNNE